MSTAVGVVGALCGLAGALVSGLVTWQVTRTQQGRELQTKSKELSDETEALKQTSADLATLRQEHEVTEKERDEARGEVASLRARSETVRKKLFASKVVRDFIQPVLLLGPRAVGKTSLRMQWHEPWKRGALSTTEEREAYILPIHTVAKMASEPHFADPEVITPVDGLVKLRIHDFPGDPRFQADVVKQAVDETLTVRRQTKKALGIVMVCMFDAQEAIDGRPTADTYAYYNGEAFRELRSLASSEVDIERLILVFNKYDLLKQALPDESDASLMDRCRKTFDPVLAPLYGIGAQGKVSAEIFTILSRTDMSRNNRGAPIVLGEAARGIVTAVAGAEVAQEVLAPTRPNYPFGSSNASLGGTPHDDGANP